MCLSIQSRTAETRAKAENPPGEQSASPNETTPTTLFSPFLIGPRN